MIDEESNVKMSKGHGMFEPETERGGLVFEFWKSDFF